MARRRFASALLVGLALGSIALPAQADPDEPSPGSFIDPSGAEVPFAPAYDRWFGPRRFPPNYARAVVENAALMGLELFVYWYDPGSNVVDWQFPDLVSKITSSEAIRFDDNMFRTNWLFHPIAGTAHYDFTRTNGFGVAGAFTAAAVSSTLYEAVFEWREVVSINDLVVTPFAGLAVGEFLFHLGDYVNSAADRPRTLDEVVGLAPFGRKLAAGTLGVVNQFHGAVAPRGPPKLSEDDLGLSSAYTHRFGLVAGLDTVTNERGDVRDLTAVSARADLVAMPGFLRPGRFATWFTNGNFTSMSVRASFDEEIRDFELLSDAHLFGHYGQSFEFAAGGVSGVAHEIAVHTALHYVDRWLLDRRDHYGVLHLLGPVGTFWFGRGPTMVRVSADVSPDFAAPGSLAYDDWVRRFGAEGTKSSLRAHGYYNAWGVSAGASGAVSSRGVTIAASGRYGHYESIDGAERALEPVTREVHMRDEILELGGALTFEPRDTILSAGITLAHVGRLSTMPPVSSARFDERLGIFAGIRF